MNTNLSKTDITNFGFVADSTTLAGYGITDAATSTQGGKADTALQNLNGALLETTPATDTTELVTVIDTAGTVTQGTLPVANIVQQEGTMLGVGRAAADGNIELQATGTNPQVRIYADDDATGVIQFRNTTTLETCFKTEQ